MTLQEAGRYLHMEIKELQVSEENGLLKGTRTANGHLEYSEQDLQLAVHLHSLQQAGMDMENLKKYAVLLRDGKNTEMAQIRILRKCRYQLLEEIHGKQQLLDRLDYLIQEKRKKEAHFYETNTGNFYDAVTFAFSGCLPESERGTGKHSFPAGGNTGIRSTYRDGRTGNTADRIH